MKISTKGRYGLRAMIDLAAQGPGKTVPLSDITDRQSLSLSYLEIIFSSLKKSGLVIGAAGAKGGYQLGAPADTITVYNVLNSLESDLSMTGHSISDVSSIGQFLDETVWTAVNEQIWTVLQSISLADLVRELDQKDLATDCSGL